MNPIEMIAKIREIQKLQANITSTAVKIILMLLEKSKSESIYKYREKFDDIFDEYANLDFNEPEETKRTTFYRAVIRAHPNILSIELRGRLTTEI